MYEWLSHSNLNAFASHFPGNSQIFYYIDMDCQLWLLKSQFKKKLLKTGKFEPIGSDKGP